MNHSYSSDTPDRKLLPFILASTSIVLAYLLHLLLSALRVSPLWFIDLPSPFAIYGALYKLYDLTLWRETLFGTRKLSATPDLSGEWTGQLLSSVDNYTSPTNCSLSIRQNWTTLSINLKTSFSSSQSTAAMILTSAPQGTILVYEYTNTPAPNAPPTMHAHTGTAHLQYAGNANELQGDYYSGRDRANQGVITLTRRPTPSVRS